MKDARRVATVARFTAMLMAVIPAAEVARAAEVKESDEEIGQLIVKLREPRADRFSAMSSRSDEPTAEAMLERVVERALRSQPADTAQAHARVRRSAEVMRFTRAVSGGAHVVGLATPLTADDAQALARRIEAQPEVEYAEPDYRVQAYLEPTDPMFSPLWGMRSWGAGARLPAAWDITTGSTGIVTAILDTGYRPHIDLGGNVVPGYDFVSDPWRANDGDGRDADAMDPGDWMTADEALLCNPLAPWASSSSWHGTHVMGTIGAMANNGRGVTGASWHGSLLPVRVLGKCGGTTSDIYDGIRWAAGLPVPGVPLNPYPAKVINMSLGSDNACGQAGQAAIDDAIAHGVTVIAAAGNSRRAVGHPANCAGVIAVAAIDIRGDKAWFSNFGVRVDLGAPGVDILSTNNSGTTVPQRDDYRSKSGTSMAAPHVAGVASLMLAFDPTLTPAELRTKLLASTRPYPEGSTCKPDVGGTLCGAGLLDAGRTLETVRADAASKRRAMPR